ncbi:FAD-dependent monooxygenase [Streptomyces amakusaensis]|uniref:Pyridine nucleotide-disulfide oxidoreductase n=1 Tax=Streptomyces amakusaensis TaxID=67271 RepID=A0ABW0APX8_9ACTN
MSDTTGRRPVAVVLGASAAGLLAATALTEFADVTIVERDVLPAGAGPRRGVPQARHAHIVWSGGVNAFTELLPGVVDDIVAQGGNLFRIMGDMVSRAPNEVWFRRFTRTHHRNLVCSRDLLDASLRKHVLGDGRITLLDDTAARGLAGTAARVTGVRISTGGQERVLAADLVIDATGRGSRAPQWLAELGLPPVAEREVDAGFAYSTRLYRAPGTTATTGFPIVNVQANPAKAPGQGGIILPIEGDRWIVTLSGTRGGEPPGDGEGFLNFARGLGDPVIGDLLEHAEPLGDVTTTRSTSNQRHYYEKAKSWPDGFTVLGDAIARYNPVYGHGLTAAAQCALAVRDTLRSHALTAPGTARRLQKAAARPVSAAWNLAVGQDALYPGATATPPQPAELLLARYVDRCVVTGAGNPRALGALLDVMSLEKPPSRLFSPADMLLPMLLGPRKPPLTGPPLSNSERKAAAP